MTLQRAMVALVLAATMAAREAPPPTARPRPQAPKRFWIGPIAKAIFPNAIAGQSELPRIAKIRP